MLCTSAARSELSIVKTLFARARTPLDLPALRVATLPTAVLSFLFIFGVLFAAIGDIKYFTATYLAWSLLDCIVSRWSAGISCGCWTMRFTIQPRAMSTMISSSAAGTR